MRVFNQQVQTNTPMNASFSSAYVPLRYIFMYNVAALVTGTPNGIISLQASNDPETNDTQTNIQSGVAPANGPKNWTMIRSSDFTLSSSGETMWNVQGIAYNYVRVNYQDLSGGTSTATVTIVFNGKGA